MTGVFEGTKRRRALTALLIGYATVRVGLGVLPGYPPDLEAFKRWAMWGALNGIHTFYDQGSNLDYPPLYGFMLTPFGYIGEALDPSYARRFLQIPPSRITQIPYSPTFSLLVKTPPLVFDLLLAALVAVLVHRYGMWRERPAWGGWLPAALVALNPAVLFLSGYMGHADAVHTFFVLLALTLILLRRPELGWISAALACMTKPLAGPYLPLLALATLMRVGFRRSCTAALASWATLAVVLAPFWLTGRMDRAIDRLFGDVDLLAKTSVNGHNLWWLLGAWQPADEPWLGPLTPRIIGFGSFGIAYLAVLAWAWNIERRRPANPTPGSNSLYDDRHWYLAVAATGFSFFAFATHMHENHLFIVIPLLVLFAGWGRKWSWLYVVVGLSVFTNLATHDLFTGEYVLSKFGGTTAMRAPTVGWYKSLGEELTRSAYLSGLEVGLAYVNSVVTLGCWATLLVWILRLRPEPSPRSTRS